MEMLSSLFIGLEIFKSSDFFYKSLIFLTLVLLLKLKKFTHKLKENLVLALNYIGLAIFEIFRHRQTDTHIR